MLNSIKRSNLSIKNSNFDSLDKPIAIDIWSIYHMFFGFFTYIILHIYFKLTVFKSFIISNILHLLYEFIDFYFSYIKVYKGIRPISSKEQDFLKIGFHANNSYINSIFDQLSNCFGFLIAYIMCK